MKPGLDDTGKPWPGVPNLAFDLIEGSWPKRTWYKRWGATTLAPHVIMYTEGMNVGHGYWSPTQEHEGVHKEQGEAACVKMSAVAGSILGTAGPLFFVDALWLAGALWVGAHWLFAGAGMACAWLRGEDPYYGSHSEEAAYAIDGRSAGKPN